MEFVCDNCQGGLYRPMYGITPASWVYDKQDLEVWEERPLYDICEACYDSAIFQLVDRDRLADSDDGIYLVFSKIDFPKRQLEIILDSGLAPFFDERSVEYGEYNHIREYLPNVIDMFNQYLKVYGR